MTGQQTESKKIIMPVKIRKLLIRAALIFLAWTLLYNLWLSPVGVPDNQMTQLVVIGTVELLALFYDDVHHQNSGIILEGVRAVNIARQCNGLELIALYTGMILIMPSNWKRMLSFILGGFVVITALNMIRCALLAWMYLHQMDLADVAHHYIFKLAIYGVVFYGWMLYSKKVKDAA